MMIAMHLKSLFLIAALYVSLAVPAQAFVLDITPTTTTATIQAGESFTVQGVITNTTGIDLLTTDIFFSFSGYDPALLQVDQLLGLDEFLLPDRTASAVIDLFSILALGESGSSTPIPIDFFAIDAYGAITSLATFQLIIIGDGPPTGVPEPLTILLLLAGIVALLLATRRRGPVRRTMQASH